MILTLFIKIDQSSMVNIWKTAMND